MSRKRPLASYSGKTKELSDGDSIFGYTSKTTNYTQDQGINFIDGDATSGNITITLLSASSFGAGNIITVRKTDSSANTVNVSGTINGLSGYLMMGQFASVTLLSNGTNYVIIGQYTPVFYLSPARAVNTNFQPSATRNMRVMYTVRVNMPSSAAQQTVRVELSSDSAATPTTVLAQIRQNENIGGLLSGGLEIDLDFELIADIKAADNVRLNVVTENGSGTASVIYSKERPI